MFSRAVHLALSCWACLVAAMHCHVSLPMSKHYRCLNEASTTPMVVVVATGGRTTAGPFYFSNDMYTSGGDMLATANGRRAVMEGIPLMLHFVLHSVNVTTTTTTTTTNTPLEGAQVFLWHADAMGVYSAVAQLGTEGDTWLRAQASSDSEGKLSFTTIVPGWYPGRAIHFHFRVRLPMSNQQDANEAIDQFYVTSQLFVSNEFFNGYRGYGLYAENAGRLMFNEDDGVFRSLDPDVATDLILQFNGSNEDGFSATFHLGIDARDVYAVKGVEDANKFVVPTTSPASLEDIPGVDTASPALTLPSLGATYSYNCAILSVLAMSWFCLVF